MSLVFLVDQYVYKLKRSIYNDNLDFRTLERRHFFCEEELRLNHRLAPDVYLTVDALTMKSDGSLEFNGHGKTVDWLVKMRRLPADRMLDSLIILKQAKNDDMYRIAETMVNFYQILSPVMITFEEWKNRFDLEIKKNEKTLIQFKTILPIELIQRLCAAQREILTKWGVLFQQRIQAGRIVEGHGDLRPEHVCMEPNPVIIDCLEFSEELRIVDSVDEIGYLALECERLEAPELAASLIASYKKLAQDYPPPALIHFYQGFRACLRARIAILHLEQKKFHRDTQWQMRASHYLQLAEKHYLAIKSTMEPSL
jgi:aminoglycoside phosphotransferase family enzyme